MPMFHVHVSVIINNIYVTSNIWFSASGYQNSTGTDKEMLKLLIIIKQHVWQRKYKIIKAIVVNILLSHICQMKFSFVDGIWRISWKTVQYLPKKNGMYWAGNVAQPDASRKRSGLKVSGFLKTSGSIRTESRLGTTTALLGMR